MWTDNETDLDFINFSSVAKTVSQVIEQADEEPVSIGVSGMWGVGKSSMIRLIRKELEAKPQENNTNHKYIFVEFNAWLYQGYDDARAALIDVVASTLLKEAQKRKKGMEKAKELVGRVNWLRFMKMSATSAASIAFGLPPVGLIGEAASLIDNVTDGDVDQEDINSAEKLAKTASEKGKSLISKKEAVSPPKKIQELRNSFEETLKEMGVTLVVLIDDLDRCLPETTISTLEAIRLLLFLKHTAFVIAADDQMIKYAVKRHFHGVEDDLATNYFDKLIQVPIRVPPLGTQEVRSYMMLLHINNSTLPDENKETLRSDVCDQLSKSWQGKRVDLKFIKEKCANLPSELITKLDSADRLAPLMTSAVGILGNPRLIKRFMNALSIRMAMAKAQSVSVDESVLAKILLFERCGSSQAYSQLIKAVIESDDGKPVFLKEWEEKLLSDAEFSPEEPWDDNFTKEWLRLSPALGEIDLRGALYVSREHSPLITPEDRLSPEAADLLGALLEHPDMASSMKDKLNIVPKPEYPIIMTKLLEKAKQEQSWGTPAILDACMLLAQRDDQQGKRLAEFLKERPAVQVSASIIPKLNGESWSKPVLDFWSSNSDIDQTVKKAINYKER